VRADSRMCGLLVGGCAYGRMSVLMGGCDG